MKIESKEGIFLGRLDLLLEEVRGHGWNGCLRLSTQSSLNLLFVDLEGGEIKSIFYKSEVILSFPSELDLLENWNYQLMTDIKLIVSQKIESMKGQIHPNSAATKRFDIENKKIIGGTPEQRKLVQSELDYFTYYGEKFAARLQEKTVRGYIVSTTSTNTVVKFHPKINETDSPYFKGERVESSNPLFYGEESFSEESK